MSFYPYLPTPNWLRLYIATGPQNPLQPISFGSQWACHPFILHCSTSSWYLVSFLSWDSAHIFPPTILSTPTWSLASSYSKQESFLAEVVSKQYDQGISVAHPNQQISPIRGCTDWCWTNIPSCHNKINSLTDRFCMCWFEGICLIPLQFPSVLYTHLQHHNDIKLRQTHAGRLLYQYFYLSLYCKGSKGLFRGCMWEGAGDRT